MNHQNHCTQQPIVITGWGVCCATGDNATQLWNSASEGRPQARWLKIPRHGAGYFPGCVVQGPAMTEADERFARQAGRAARLALAAARQAWRHANLETANIPGERLGILVGTSRGPMDSWLEHAGKSQANARIRATSATATAIASLSGLLSLAFHAKGPCLTLSASCASSAAAIAIAARELIAGAADVVLAGGAEASLQPALLAQMDAAGLLGRAEKPEAVCRPFDSARNGTVVGEGAAFLVLERLDDARRRGAHCHARLAGWSVGAEAGSRAGLEQSGTELARVIHEALKIAGISLENIGYINAHGAGTVQGDRMEARALEKVFNRHLKRIPCSSTKPVTGHCLGATAAIEAIICLLAMEHGTIPPTANLQQPEADCPLWLPQKAIPMPGFSAALSTSAGLWGNLAELIFSKVD